MTLARLTRHTRMNMAMDHLWTTKTPGRRRLRWTLSTIAVVILSGPIAAQAPSGQLRVDVVEGLSGQGRRLVVLNDGKELGSIAVPPRVSATALDRGLKETLRHPNGNDLAVGFKGDKGSFVVVFLLQPNGAYLAVDVSRVELANIGVIGHNRTYRDVQTMPIEWLHRPEGDDSVQIRLQTRARDVAGRRYRPTEPLIITRDGRALWR
jgi:hypothetical protein